MATLPVPLSLLLTREVYYEWHDAVAIVAQLIGQMRASGPVERIPEFRLLSLDAGGTVSAVSPQPSTPAMPGAALLLQQLLSGKEQPTPLRLYAMQAATSDPLPSIDEFAAELAKFERPGRVARLAALHTAAVDRIGTAALEEASRDRAERPLTVKMQPASTERGAASKVPAKSPSAGRPGGGQAVALVVVVAAIVGGGTWFFLRGAPAAAPASVVDGSSPAPDGAGADTAGGPSSGTAIAPAPGTRSAAPPSTRRTSRATTSPVRPSAAVASAETQLARARELFARQEYAAASAAIDRLVEMLGSDHSPQAEELRQLAANLAEVARAAVVEQSAAAARTYRSGDPGVTDPVPLAYLPRKPDPSTPPERLQVLEVQISPSGVVESAKFVMNRPSFRNSWWTSAAKAWRFQPATKDGQPVRFLMRIVMDDSASR
ncbi:MAG: hypothetical protein AB7H96_23725 [Vicinamibacterales bacterium]